jgi:hypothetical protein
MAALALVVRGLLTGRTSLAGIARLGRLFGPPLLRRVRDHWRIENCLHWVRDMTLKQDVEPLRRACPDGEFERVEVEEVGQSEDLVIVPSFP